MSKNIRALSARQIEGKTLFEALCETADETGCPSDKQLRRLAKERLISPATLLGTSSFYDLLSTDNRGKRAYVCTGTACLLSGKQKLARTVLAKRFADEEIGEAVCFGRCYRGGAIWVKDYDQEKSGSIPNYCHSSRALLTGDIAELEGFYQSALSDPDRIVKELSRSGLRGRGGAGFPFADKLITCARASASKGGPIYIVCNGDEGDPGAFSDRYLLEQQPHRVLAGMLAAAHVAGADTGLLYIRAEYPLALTCMAAAIEEFEKTPAFAQSGVRFRIIRGAGSYICGEETALLNSIEGLRPEVRTRPPFPAEEGLFGQPTLLSNVETFAAVPWILENGGAAFADMGTDKSAGVKLVSLDSNFNQPGVHEVEMGTALEQVIYEYGGGFRTEVKALQVGGPLGGVVPIDKIETLSLDFESFEREGFLLGHAGIVAIPQDFPMIEFLRHLFSFMASESCGKCLPCRLGTEKGRRLLVEATHEKQIDRQAFEDLLETLALGSLCGLGGGLPLPVRNILAYFAEELNAYFA